MNPEVKVLWLEALRSGEYEKGVRALKVLDNQGVERFCCLGVLCDIYRKKTGNGSWDLHEKIPNRGIFKEGASWNGAFIPYTVSQWAGIDSSDGRFNDNERMFNVEDEINSLAAVNDRVESKDFSKVIKAIEKYF